MKRLALFLFTPALFLAVYIGSVAYRHSEADRAADFKRQSEAITQEFKLANAEQTVANDMLEDQTTELQAETSELQAENARDQRESRAVAKELAKEKLLYGVGYTPLPPTAKPQKSTKVK